MNKESYNWPPFTGNKIGYKRKQNGIQLKTDTQT